jgi:hypothetical protein
MLTILVGVLVGVLTGMLSWILMYRGFRPRIHWSDELTKRDRGLEHPTRWRYAMLLTNAGNWRDVVNVSVQVRARFPTGRPNSFHIFEIPTDTKFVPVLRHRKGKPWRRRRGDQYAVVLQLHAIDRGEPALASIPAHLKDAIFAGTAELEPLLDAGLDLRFNAWGYDSTTGAFAVRRSIRVSSRSQVVSVDIPAEVAADVVSNSVDERAAGGAT